MKNMLHQKPCMSVELQLLQYLQPRMTFSPQETVRYETLQKGYLGEIAFYNLVKNNAVSGNFLFDLRLASNGTEFQIDSLYIENDSLTIFEVKNYEGDFFVEKDKWYVAHSKQEIRNPLTQLQRSEFLLRHLLKKSYPNLSIKTCIVFINKAFTLYQAPLGLPAIFPTQLTRFLERISSNRSGISARITAIANHLASLHVANSSYEKLPIYSYNKLRRGLTCEITCGGMLEKHTVRTFICHKCQQTKTIQHAIYQNIKEFKLLFPERKVTTGIIHDWCKFAVSKAAILRTLKTYFYPVPNGKHTHYLPTPKEDKNEGKE